MGRLFGEKISVKAIDSMSPDSKGRILTVASTAFDYTDYWAGCVTRMVLDSDSITAIKALPTNTLIAQRLIDFQGSASIGSLKIYYSTTYTYFRSVGINQTTNDRDTFVFRVGDDTPAITATNVTLNQIILDCSANNKLKNATVLTDGGNGARGVDGDASSVTDTVVWSPTDYTTAFEYDILSVVSIQGVFSKYAYLVDADTTGSIRIQISSDRVTWTTVDSQLAIAPCAWTTRGNGLRLGSATNVRYIRIQFLSSVPGVGNNYINFKLYELMLF